MQRRLAAIMAADMVGYSRLMSADEEGTIARQKSYRKSLIDPQIAENSGRIVNTSGDGMLVEFASVVDAVRCAAAIQQAMIERESDVPAEMRIRYRIGINSGDIVVDGDDILGDGVNIAARLEALAEPGGICISDHVHQSIRGRLQLVFEDMGLQQVKNIAQPLRVWKLRKGAGEGMAEINTDHPGATPATGPAPELPDKPSIAVLPFTNMSDDKEQEYFADGMAEDIITELSRMPWFFVIARNSSFAYKGRSVDVKQVAAELGVAYVLEGSVRKAGNRLRINAQLIDARTGNHVWAERYDREITDIFDIQDEINQAIVGAVAPEFVSAEVRRSQRKDPADLDAWECVMRGRAHLWKMGRTDSAEARGLFQRAIDLSSGRLGLSDLALVHFLDAFYGWGESRQESVRAMVDLAEKAVAIDDHDPLALTILAWAYLFAYKWDEALATIDQAIAISPNFAPAIGVRAGILACADEPDLAVAAGAQAVRRSPRDAFMPFWLMALYWAHHSLQNYEPALEVARQAVRLAPENPTFRRQLAVAYRMLGRDEESRREVAEYLRIEPGATSDDARYIPSLNKEHLERFVRALEDAGVPKGKAAAR